MKQTFYNEDTTDCWSIRSQGYDEYPGWTWLTVMERPTGITIFMGTVRDGQVASTALLAVKRHEDMLRDRIAPPDDA